MKFIDLIFAHLKIRQYVELLSSMYKYTSKCLVHACLYFDCLPWTHYW
jgi:hypothetical protein